MKILNRYTQSLILEITSPKPYNLTYANLTYANLVGANLVDANLTGANLTGANLTDANLVGANLTGANLVDANLVGANLTDANLVGANLTGANLTDANLVGANLTGANLVDANLVGANLTDANLVGANLTGATVSITPDNIKALRTSPLFTKKETYTVCPHCKVTEIIAPSITKCPNCGNSVNVIQYNTPDSLALRLANLEDFTKNLNSSFQGLIKDFNGHCTHNNETLRTTSQQIQDIETHSIDADQLDEKIEDHIKDHLPLNIAEKLNDLDTIINFAHKTINEI